MTQLTIVLLQVYFYLLQSTHNAVTLKLVQKKEDNMANAKMFEILENDDIQSITFNSLKNAQIFARKAESEMDTRFAGNFSDPNWVCISDCFTINYDKNLFELSGKHRFYKIYKQA